MAPTNITPVILCGGSGTRLWPLSRKSYPKQFTPLLDEQSLYLQSAERLTGAGFNDPLIITNSDFRFIVTQQLSESGINPGAILIEPEARNTAPALLAAAIFIAQNDPDSLILASPSDHYIQNTEQFQKTVQAGVNAAKAGQIVTFGVTPTRPETGYGYVELPVGTKITPDSNEAVTLVGFVEKPDHENAVRMINEGRFLWNSGIFLYSARTLIEAFETYAPQMLKSVSTAIGHAKTDLGFLRLDPKAWAGCEDISIDFAVMEKAKNLSVVTHHGDWSDLGGWEAVRQHTDLDADGVGTHGSAIAVDCRETLLRSENENVQLVGFGLDNIVAVAMHDAVLVADRSRVAELGTVVKQMRVDDIRQADTFPRDFRPWGYFETLTLSDRFQVKRIVVNPGASLSLQSHLHRSEHWIVVVGTAKVTVDDEVKLISENGSVYIPLGAKHRLENPGKVAMELIEVQTGSYLGEDDIIRYADRYARNNSTSE